MDFPEHANTRNQPAGGFATTHWSLIRAAGGDDTAAREAMASLCGSYWFPLYAFVRRKGHWPQDAEDLTQEFFAQLLEHNWVTQADRSRGRFRSFLLTAFSHFLANQWDKAAAQKRGGHLRRVPLSMEDAEGRLAREPVDTSTPEQEFERQWALIVLEQVLARLREESVFKPDQLPALENAKGKAIYLLQSPQDRVAPFRFAEAAERPSEEPG